VLAGNVAPVGADDTASVIEYGAVAGNVLAGAGADYDGDGDTLTVAQVLGTSGSFVPGAAVVGRFGTFTLFADGSYSYVADHAETLAAGQSGVDVFTYTVSDGKGGTDTATLNIGVWGTNYGTPGNNYLLGTAAAESFFGDAGDDIIDAGAGGDVLDGGAGYDVLISGYGNDKLIGRAGNDVLYGGAGKDVLSGGAGYDYFVFNTRLSASSNVDLITDFNVKYDTIRLENAVMKGVGSHLGKLSSAMFWKSTTGLAHDGNDRIIYDTASGWLNYDSNGSAAGGAVHIAALAPKLALTYADFVVI